MIRKLLTVCVAAFCLAGLAPDAGAVTTLKIATLAPTDSPWGRNYKKYAKAVSDASNGDLTIDFQFNGQAGDENLVVQKIRAGQLDGGMLTAYGLATTGVNDVLIFQVPGLFKNWAKLDEVRDAVKPELNKEFEARGFTILGWGDVGAVKSMTVGYEVKRPNDLRGKPVCYLSGDPVSSRFWAALGGVTPKVVGVSEILPGLTDGTITFLSTSALSAEQMQFASRITHMSSNTTGYAIGAFLFSSSRLQSLTQAQRDILLGKSAEMSDSMTTTIRRLDAEAFERMKKTKIVYDSADDLDGRREWFDFYTKFLTGLRGTIFTAPMFDRIIQLAAPPPRP